VVAEHLELLHLDVPHGTAQGVRVFGDPKRSAKRRSFSVTSLLATVVQVLLLGFCSLVAIGRQGRAGIIWGPVRNLKMGPIIIKNCNNK
jgi:hypothetical protein